MQADYYYFASAAVSVDSSHMTASSSASWSRFSPPSNFVKRHLSTMCFMVCRWPQPQEDDRARPHLCKLARHGPGPVRKRFIGDHVGFDKGDRNLAVCQRVGSVTIVWFTTEADDQSSLHCVIVSTDVMSDHIGRRDACMPCRWILKDISVHRPVWMGFDDLKHIVSCRFTT